MTLEQEISSFIKKLIEEGFEFKAMIDPHQGWLKINKDTIPQKNIKYRIQLHLAPSRVIVKNEELKDKYYEEIKDFIYNHMKSFASFIQFEKAVTQLLIKKFKETRDCEKITPNSEEERLDYLASDGYSSKKVLGASDSLKEKEASLINFINPKASYSWKELFSNKDNKKLWEHVDAGYIDLGAHFDAGCTDELCSIGFEDWTGALTIRGGFVEIKEGVISEIDLARPAQERYEEKKAKLEQYKEERSKSSNGAIP